MARWMTAILKWGGLALAAINLAALLYVWSIGAPASLGAGPETEDAPYAAYVLMALVGLAAAVAGFVLDRRAPPRL